MTEFPLQHRSVFITVVWTACFAVSFFATIIFFVSIEGIFSSRTVLFFSATILPQIIFGIVLQMYIRREKTAEKKLTTLLEEAETLRDSAVAEKEQMEKMAAISVRSERSMELGNADKDIVTRSRIVRSVFSELCGSISHNLSSTTEPISAELLRIRKTSENFLSGIKVYGDAIKNQTAILQVQKESDVFNRNLQSLSETVKSVFSTLDERIASLKTVSNRIGDISGDISEISEKIRILSFNASIEAARAGNAGNGFRVIAGEIKKLSSDTEERLVAIRATLKETKIIFENIGTGLKENKQKILVVVSERQNGFESFERMLTGYMPQLEQLYTGVNNVIASLSKSMDVISPVVQLHEITSQEIGNLCLVTGDFCGYVERKAISDFPSTIISPGPAEAKETAAEIRNRLTTENELKALERGIKEIVPEADIDMGINDRGIEFF